MKMMNKTTLAMAIIAAMGISSQAFAIVKIGSDDATMKLLPSSVAPNSQNAYHTTTTANAASGGYVRFAAEQSGESSLPLMNHYAAAAVTNYDGDLTAAIPVPPSYTVDSTKTLSIKVTLTGGAKFANEAQLVCSSSGWVTATPAVLKTARDSSVATESGLITTASSGGLGITISNKSTATFNITPGLTTNTTGFCLLSFVTAGLAINAPVTAYAIGARGDIGISVETTYIQANQSTKITTNGILAKFVTALKSVVDVNVVNVGGNSKVPSVSIDVKQASKGFEATTDVTSKGAPNTTTVAPLGSVYVTSAGTTGSTIRLAAVSAGALNADWKQVMVTGTVTINGPLMAGVKEVNLYKGTTTACITTPAIPLKGTPATTSGGGSVTISNILLADLTNGVNICATVDGTTILNAGQLTAVLTGGGVDNFAPDMGAETNIVEVDINGARLRVLNIPPVGSTENATIRFYNTSSQDVAVTGTLYGMDGKVLGTPDSVLFAALKANDVEMLSSATLGAKFGLSAPWTGRAWLLVQAQVDAASFRVVALMRSANGTLINLSNDATN